VNDACPVFRRASRLISHPFSQRKYRPRRGYDCLLSFHKKPDHLLCFRHSGRLLDRAQSPEFSVGGGCGKAQRPDSLSNQIYRKRQFVVLSFEHQMERLKHRSGDVPVEVMRLEVERVSIGKQSRQSLRDFGPVGFFDSNIYFHAASV
jgi:hypothetical protein